MPSWRTEALTGFDWISLQSVISGFPPRPMAVVDAGEALPMTSYLSNNSFKVNR